MKPRYLLGILVVAGIVTFFGVTAHANPSYFLKTQSATATTTKAYMTAGTATTTLTLDLNASGARTSDSASLNMQFTGSTTAAILGVAIEYSHDNIDWYSDVTDVGATTTPTRDLTTNINYKLVATGNLAGGGAGTSSTTLRTMVIQIPTRYVRAVFSIPAGSVNGAIWAQITAKQQAGN